MPGPETEGGCSDPSELCQNCGSLPPVELFPGPRVGPGGWSTGQGWQRGCSGDMQSIAIRWLLCGEVSSGGKPSDFFSRETIKLYFHLKQPPFKILMTSSNFSDIVWGVGEKKKSLNFSWELVHFLCCGKNFCLLYRVPGSCLCSVCLSPHQTTYHSETQFAVIQDGREALGHRFFFFYQVLTVFSKH